MKNAIAAVACLVAVASFGGQVQAKGCIKGAIVGGIAGHLAGHGFLGAAGGCAVGRHLANERARRDAVGARPVETTGAIR